MDTVRAPPELLRLIAEIVAAYARSHTLLADEPLVPAPMAKRSARRVFMRKPAKANA